MHNLEHYDSIMKVIPLLLLLLLLFCVQAGDLTVPPSPSGSQQSLTGSVTSAR
jgi:hypothetical protein